MDFANEVLSRSLIVTGVDIQPGDHLITLSTCTYDFEEARFAIVARRVREGEAETVDTSAAYINPNPVMPKAWYEAKKIAALVAGVSLSPENLSLQPGETAALTATVLPNTAVNRNVSWSSSDSSVASVDQSGNVTALRKRYGGDYRYDGGKWFYGFCYRNGRCRPNYIHVLFYRGR